MKQKTITALVASVSSSLEHQRPGTASGRVRRMHWSIPGHPIRASTDKRVMFRVATGCAEGALRLGQGFDMSRPDACEYATTTPQVRVFTTPPCQSMAVVADPSTRPFFGSGFYNSAIEVPGRR